MKLLYMSFSEACCTPIAGKCPFLDADHSFPHNVLLQLESVCGSMMMKIVCRDMACHSCPSKGYAYQQIVLFRYTDDNIQGTPLSIDIHLPQCDIQRKYHNIYVFSRIGEHVPRIPTVLEADIRATDGWDYCKKSHEKVVLIRRY